MEHKIEEKYLTSVLFYQELYLAQTQAKMKRASCHPTTKRIAKTNTSRDQAFSETDEENKSTSTR